LSISAASANDNTERGSVALLYLDIVLVLVAAVPALSLGAPRLGYIVGAVAWIVMRLAQIELDKHLRTVHDLRRRLGLGVAYSMTRVWVLAGAIIAAGVAVSRHDGLTAALVIFGAFSVNFIRNAFEHITQARSTTR
jgi:hypothetical protein